MKILGLRFENFKSVAASCPTGRRKSRLHVGGGRHHRLSLPYSAMGLVEEDLLGETKNKNLSRNELICDRSVEKVEYGLGY
ncbi:hypothetical protein AHAS_Ahas07G0137900 [Arachis hypogaea]